MKQFYVEKIQLSQMLTTETVKISDGESTFIVLKICYVEEKKRN